MCGIAGFAEIKKANFNPSLIIESMVESMVHRGPDDEGYAMLSYSDKPDDGRIVFGHSRLKIIDLSEGGHQPMFNLQKNLCIIYNGEIYNYLEIKDELMHKGYGFASTSDTEVVLNAYAEWGVECFKKFNGMWAMAIFDKRQHKLILSRDRFGKKPLYYYKAENVFVFASEIKAILKHPYVEKSPNYDKIFRYIAKNYRYVDIDNQSYFLNILQVPKSSFMVLDEDFRTRAYNYWELNPGLTVDITDIEAINKFRDLLIDSVRLRLRSDVPVGCMLSGGLDSTSITCIAYKIIKKPIITFSGITGDTKGVYDESEYIDSLIKETSADYHYIKPDPTDLFDTVDELLSFHDEPVCTVTWYSLYLIAKKVKLEHTPVILNGHGGDELLAGYWDHYQYNFYDLEQERNPQLLRYELDAWKNNHNRNISELDVYKKYIKELLAKGDIQISRFSDYSDVFCGDFISQFKKEIRWKNKGYSLLTKRLYSEIMYETVPASLRPEDRNTMSQSLESRSPFLDYRLVEYAFTLPNKVKIRNGLGKWILRESMKGILPDKVRLRKDKAGFIAPADEWFRTVNKKQLLELINSDSLKKRGIFNIERIQAIFDEHVSGGQNHQMFLWQLINLELWFRRFFDEQR